MSKKLSQKNKSEVRSLCNDTNITLKEIAQDFNKHESTMSNYLKNQRPLGRPRIVDNFLSKKLKKYFNIGLSNADTAVLTGLSKSTVSRHYSRNEMSKREMQKYFS